ncbi:MAG: dicarboxylate/amino acid:cation symporter [Prochlorothrix sp.]
MNLESLSSAQKRASRVLRPLPKIVKNPFFIVFTALLGALVGSFQPELASQASIIGSIYIDLLKMCVGPIVVSCVALGVFDLLSHRSNEGLISRLLIFLFLGILVCAVIPTAIGAILTPGRSMSEATLSSLGIIVNTNVVDFSLNLNSSNLAPPPEPIFKIFLGKLVPDNAFAPLVTNDILKVIVVSSILGGGMTLIPHERVVILKDVLNALRLSFNKILFLLTYLLPFALFSIVSNTVATVDAGVFASLLRFMVCTLLAFAVLIAGSSIWLLWRTNRDRKAMMASLMDVFVVALATQSIMATLPQALSSLTEDFRLNARQVNIALPLVLTLGRFGNVAYFAIASILAIFIYDRSLGFSMIFTLLMLNMFAGIATAGSIGIASLTMLSITLDTLQIPTEAVLTLLIVVDPIIAPLRALVTVLVSMGVVGRVAAPESPAITLFRTAVLRLQNRTANPSP